MIHHTYHFVVKCFESPVAGKQIISHLIRSVCTHVHVTCSILLCSGIFQGRYIQWHRLQISLITTLSFHILLYHNLTCMDNLIKYLSFHHVFH